MALYEMNARQLCPQNRKRILHTCGFEDKTNDADTHRNHQKAGPYDLVIIARKVPPVPISNTTVKLLSADGTMSQGMGE